MLINRIERSMDIMLEGLDQSNPYLMLEAAQEFDQGIKTMVQICKQFQQAMENGVKNSNLDNTGIEALIEKTKSLAKEFQGIDTKKVPSTFKFTAATKMRDPKSDDSVAKVTQAAASLDVLYSATKDAIIGIAEAIEASSIGKSVFSIGAKGIVIKQEFAKVDKIEEKISLKDMVTKTPEEILGALSGIPEDGGWKNTFSDLISQAAGGDVTGDKKAAAEKQFLAEFQKLKDELNNGFGKISQALQNVEPNEDLKAATKSEGFLKSLFKSKNPYKLDAKTAEGIVSAVTSISLSGLVALTQNLIQMTEDVDSALSAQISGISAQAETQDQSNIPKKASSLIDKLTEVNGVDGKMAIAILAIGEKAGYTNEKDKDFSNIKDHASVIKELTPLVGSEDLDAVIQILNMKAQGEDETDDPNEVAEIASDVETEVKNDENLGSGDAVKMAIDDWENQLSDRQKKVINAKPRGSKEGRLPQLKRMVGEVTPPNVEPPTDIQKVAAVADDWGKEHKIDDPKSPIGNPRNFSPKEMRKLVDILPQIVKGVEDEESDGVDNDGDGETDERGEASIKDSLYRRWGKLAGIIKG